MRGRAERRSEYPLARAILSAANGRGLPGVKRFLAHPGRGAEGEVEERGIPLELRKRGPEGARDIVAEIFASQAG